jgi:integrase
MAALAREVPLGEEWDQARLLVVPLPGGLLCPRDVCVADGCESLVHDAGVLCRAHDRQFAASGASDVASWLAAAGPRPPEKFYLTEQLCTVGEATGKRCALPAFGPERLCDRHSEAWRTARRVGSASSLPDFAADAVPLEGYGPCAAASCWLPACYKQSRLCEAHYHAWHRHGCPGGRRLEAFLAAAPQPASSRVLSLRGLPELVRLELLYVIGRRQREQASTRVSDMRAYVDRLRSEGAGSLTELEPRGLDPSGAADQWRFARFAFDRARLAYAAPGSEQQLDRWDLRVFGLRGGLDFTRLRQGWLRETAKSWASARLFAPMSPATVTTVQHEVHSLGLMSEVLASSPGGGNDPTALGRPDIERFLARARTFTSSRTGQPYGPHQLAMVVQDCARVLRESREMGLLADVPATFAIRRGEEGQKVPRDEEGRALPGHVVAQLDARLDLLRVVPGSAAGPAHHNRGTLGDRAGEMAVLVYKLLKGTGRRAGEVASLHLDCLGTDEQGRPVLIYDNHKARRLGRRLPVADSDLVSAVRAQQAWVAGHFPRTPRERLWLLPRPAKNSDGTAHISAAQVAKWVRAWVAAIPSIDAGTNDEQGRPVPFDRKAVHPHAFRHTYAQTLADQGVAAPVLRDLMDHSNLGSTLGYFKNPRELHRTGEKAQVACSRH